VSDGIELTDDEYDTFRAVLAEQRCQHSHADTACPPPPERAILLDLIAELRDEHWTKVWAVPPATGDNWCQGCGEYQPCPSLQIADRAEVRLREVSDE